MLAGWRWIYFHDPDGITIELVEVAYTTPDDAAGSPRTWTRIPRPLPSIPAPRGSMTDSTARRALVVGSTGIVGQSLAAHAPRQGWDVFGLSRSGGARCAA